MDKTSLLYKISCLGAEALKKEAELSPKPGLVDAFDRGAHKDMDIDLLRKSALSFREGFYKYAECGFLKAADEADLFKKIRIIGMEIEDNMLRVTEGINTHKGANFSFGIFLAAIGLFIKRNPHKKELPFSMTDFKEIIETIKKMTCKLTENDFKNIESKENLSNGEKLYLKHGFAGIRKEAELGYPIITEKALPRLFALREEGKSDRECFIDILFTIMAYAEDSNIVSRGGFDSLLYVQETAKDFLKKGSTENPRYLIYLEELNQEFKRRNLSPGGSADLLALTIFLESITASYSR